MGRVAIGEVLRQIERLSQIMGKKVAAIRAAQDASPSRIVRGIKSITGQSANEVPLPVTFRKGALEGWVADLSGNVDRAEETPDHLLDLLRIHQSHRVVPTAPVRAPAGLFVSRR